LKFKGYAMTFTPPAASHFINGQYVEDTDGPVIDLIYPATGAVLGQVHGATSDIIEQALQSAQQALKACAATSGTIRGRILRRAANIIRDQNRALSILETYDIGEPLSETLFADATSGADALEYFGGLAGSLTGEHIQLGEDWVYTIREALGVCVGIGAWNYPTQIACWKAAPAMACGNTMVFKPSETKPVCALKVAEILSQAGLPDGVFNVIQGQGQVGASLVTGHRVAKVSLTGSVPTGRKVYAAAAEGVKHVTMELGGKSPLILFEDANIENAVGGAILANFYASGQVCSNGTRVFVHKAIKHAFLERLVERLRQAVIGDPMDETTNFGPLVSQRQMEIVQSFIAKGRDAGARLVYGGGAGGARWLLYRTHNLCRCH
jgi:betaine-aldehyde dehydrogenase